MRETGLGAQRCSGAGPICRRQVPAASCVASRCAVRCTGRTGPSRAVRDASVTLLPFPPDATRAVASSSRYVHAYAMGCTDARAALMGPICKERVREIDLDGI